MIAVPGNTKIKPPYRLAAAVEKMPEQLAKSFDFNPKGIGDFPWRYMGCVDIGEMTAHLKANRPPVVECPLCWLRRRSSMDGLSVAWSRCIDAPLKTIDMLIVNTGTEEAWGQSYFVARCMDCNTVLWMDVDEGEEENDDDMESV